MDGCEDKAIQSMSEELRAVPGTQKCSNRVHLTAGPVSRSKCKAGCNGRNPKKMILTPWIEDARF